jgi:preprotein translocase subunit SecA
VGVVYPGMPHADKRAAYAADITYGTNNEFGFDYLRDNMALSKADRYQRGLHYAIVDEVDSILIDEARTPLIISGPADESPELYIRVNRIVPRLSRQAEEEGEGDFWVDEKSKQVHLSEAGMEHAEQRCAKPASSPRAKACTRRSNRVVHHLNAALRAHAIYQRDVDYIVRDGEVIVDEFTGRTLPAAAGPKACTRPWKRRKACRSSARTRRWPDHLPEPVPHVQEAVRHDRHGRHRSLRIPEHLRPGSGGHPDQPPTVRKDRRPGVPQPQGQVQRGAGGHQGLRQARPAGAGGHHVDRNLRTAVRAPAQGRREARSAQRQAARARGAHRRQAGRPARSPSPPTWPAAAPTSCWAVRWKPSGRLGEDASDEQKAAAKAEWQKRHDAVKAAGGLHIVGTERHESRRIDNQLRGRSGRQGDPGSSRFYLSLEDNLMRIFASDWVQKAMRLMGMKEDDVIEDRMVSRQIEKAQRKVEAHNFDIRKNLLDYDDVNNDQRKVIYAAARRAARRRVGQGQRRRHPRGRGLRPGHPLRAAELGGRAVGPAGPAGRAGVGSGAGRRSGGPGQGAGRAGRRGHPRPRSRPRPRCSRRRKRWSAAKPHALEST